MRGGGRILISAGETSGDRLGAGLARALLARRPDLELLGMGGPRMREAGVRLVQEASEVAVVGISEVLAHLPAIRRAMQRLVQRIEEERPDLVVPVDFPDFNLRLAARARRRGVEVVYFVSPQVWAWRRRRVHRIRRLVRRMLVLFPFEVPFYEAAGVPVSFVGHPLAEPPSQALDLDALRRATGLAEGGPIVALMPGSRRLELARLVGPLVAAAALVHARRPDTRFVVPLAPGLADEPVCTALAAAGLGSVARVHRGDFPDLLALCSCGVVASGTASLEAAVAGLPVVVVYRMSPVSYAIGRALVHLEHVALPNLVAGRRVVPERIQSACTGAAIAADLLGWLEDPAAAARVRDDLLAVRARLGGPGVWDRAASAVVDELDRVRGESA